MDPGQLKRRVLLDLLAHPLTFGPALAGLSALLVAWGGDMGAGMLTFLGLSGVLASVGSFTTHWLLRSDELTRRAYESLEKEAAAEKEARLDALQRRLSADKDARDEKLLGELRQIYCRFREDTTWVTRLGQRSAVEITSKVEKLFQGCIQSLERSLDLAQAAGKMATKEGRRTALDAREKLLEEVAASIQQMAHTIDGVHALGLDQKAGDDLARIRQELDESLNVARRVEERMQSIEQELGHSDAERE
jgi:methyl-accepting chemotaxis protein